MSKEHVCVYPKQQEKGVRKKMRFMHRDEPIKIALLFPQEICIRGIHRILANNPRMDIIKSHTAFEEGIRFWEQQLFEKWPDVMLISDELKERKKDNLHVIEALKALQPKLNIIMMSPFEKDDFTVWFDAGVKGYLFMNGPIEELEIGITAVYHDCYCLRVAKTPLQIYKEIKKNNER